MIFTDESHNNFLIGLAFSLNKEVWIQFLENGLSVNIHAYFHIESMIDD